MNDMPSAESIRFRINIGTWYDEIEGKGLPVLADGRIIADSPESLVEIVVEAAREQDFTPWQHEVKISYYYANASSISWEAIASVAPLAELALDPENLRLVAGAILGALFGKIVGRLPFQSDPIELSEVSKRARDYCVQVDQEPPVAYDEISASPLANGGFEVVLLRTTDQHTIVCRLDVSGVIVARVDTDAIVEFFERRRQEADQKGGGPS